MGYAKQAEIRKEGEEDAQDELDLEDEDGFAWLDPGNKKLSQTKFPPGCSVIYCRCSEGNESKVVSKVYHGVVVSVGKTFFSDDNTTVYKLQLHEPSLHSLPVCSCSCSCHDHLVRKKYTNAKEKDLVYAPQAAVWLTLMDDQNVVEAVVLGSQHCPAGSGGTCGVCYSVQESGGDLTVYHGVRPARLKHRETQNKAEIEPDLKDTAGDTENIGENSSSLEIAVAHQAKTVSQAAKRDEPAWLGPNQKDKTSGNTSNHSQASSQQNGHNKACFPDDQPTDVVDVESDLNDTAVDAEHVGENTSSSEIEVAQREKNVPQSAERDELAWQGQNRKDKTSGNKEGHNVRELDDTSETAPNNPNAEGLTRTSQELGLIAVGREGGPIPATASELEGVGSQACMVASSEAEAEMDIQPRLQEGTTQQSIMVQPTNGEGMIETNNVNTSRNDHPRRVSLCTHGTEKSGLRDHSRKLIPILNSGICETSTNKNCKSGNGKRKVNAVVATSKSVQHAFTPQAEARIETAEALASFVPGHTSNSPESDARVKVSAPSKSHKEKPGATDHRGSPLQSHSRGNMDTVVASPSPKNRQLKNILYSVEKTAAKLSATSQSKGQWVGSICELEVVPALNSSPIPRGNLATSPKEAKAASCNDQETESKRIPRRRDSHSDDASALICTLSDYPREISTAVESLSSSRRSHGTRHAHQQPGTMTRLRPTTTDDSKAERVTVLNAPENNLLQNIQFGRVRGRLHDFNLATKRIKKLERKGDRIGDYLYGKCLRWHLGGRCNSSCSRRSDHKRMSADEARKFEEALTPMSGPGGPILTVGRHTEPANKKRRLEWRPPR